jgi:hypothetical protein
MQPFQKLRHCGRAMGLLQSIQSEEEYQIARIGEKDLVLPLQPDLSSFIGSRIGLAMIGEQLYVRGLA